ncbi:MAG: ric methyl-transferase [Gammaproteobacteria bacterium]|nr:ric methyl-transferase [Gammaproteobacteria bacterium]
MGREIASAEKLHMSQLLSVIPGNHLLQLGKDSHDWLPASRIMYKCILEQQVSAAPVSAIAGFNQLPFSNEMFEVVILPHIIDCASNYPAILREAARVTSGEGRIIILGFTSGSLRALSSAKPPVGKLPSFYKIRYWLKQSGCEIEQLQTFFFRPLIRQAMVLNNLGFMENIGKFCWPNYGACYLIVARKKILARIPLSQKVKNWWRYVVSKPIAEPSTRNHSQ